MHAVQSTEKPMVIGVGIDTARYGHHVTFLRDDRQPAAKAMSVSESRQGYESLRRRLETLHKEHPQAEFYARLDAAGQYAVNLERFLRELPLPITISVGEPKRNKDYHHAMFPKSKSDATESHAMARYAVVEQPPATAEVPEEIYALRELASRLQGRVRDATRARNRLHNLLARTFPELATVVNDLSARWVLQLLQKYPTPEKITRARFSSLMQINYMKEEKARQIQKLAKSSVATLRGALAEAMVREAADDVLHVEHAVSKLEKLLLQAYEALPCSGHRQVETIPGIGKVTAAVLVAKIVSIERFPSPKHLVGYFGVFPEEETSGVDRYGNPLPTGRLPMSAKGSDLVRRYLWFAAFSASSCNPAVRALYARLRARGTRGDVAMGHCMRKLLHLVYAVWTSDKPFNKDHYPWENAGHKIQSPDPTKTAQQPAAQETADRETSDQEVPDRKTTNQQTTDHPTADAQQEAAGRKRDVIPVRKAVTAASSNVQPNGAPGKPAAEATPPANKRGSVDYAYLREQITIEQVLRHLRCWDRFRGPGAERRGPCPVHAPDRERSRSCAVNVTKNVFCCYYPDCRAQGNSLDLWSAVHGLPLYDAALHLAETFHLQLTRGSEKRSP